jgi:hypothetical protein
LTLPEIIAIRFTEEEAGYVSLRPVVRQTFYLRELTDMVLSVTGKDARRVEQILRAGAVTYNGYRYSWQGFPAEPGEIAALIAPFPENDPSRAFRPAEATAVIFEFGEKPSHAPVELTRGEASARRLLRPRSPWDHLLEVARTSPPAYERYSYPHRADLYRRPLTFVEGHRLMQGVLSAAARGLRVRLLKLPPPAAIVFQCPRAAQAAIPKP